MTGGLNKVDCAEFQSHLADMIGAGEDLSQHPHILSCELCHALLADLQTIADAARQLFPAVEPPDDLWKNIESAIKGKDD